MKALYWKTRPLRRTADGGRRPHWPGVALNLALAFVLVTLLLGGLVLAGLEGNFAELFSLADALLPIVVTWTLALFALGLGYWLTAPLDCLSGENGEPSQQRISRRLRWDCTRAVLFGGLAAVTVLAAAYTLSGWQGRRAWEAYRAEAEKRGVVFDLEKLMPPPVPDAENFAATPLLRPFQSGNPEYSEYAGRLKTQAPMVAYDRTVRGNPPLTAGIFVGRRENLTLWQEHYRSSTNFPKWPEPRTPAEDVLKALSLWDAELAELRSATTRPSARFNTKTTEDGVSTLIPHVPAMRTVLWAVGVRAVAELALNQTNEAFADVALMFRLGDTLKQEPLLITHLSRVGMHSLTLKAVWEGMLDHRWSDSQLTKWQEELAKLNFAVELRHAMAGERAFGNRAIEFIRRRPEMLPSLGNPGGSSMSAPSPSLRTVPGGWFYREQISYNKMFDDFIVTALPTEVGKFDAALIRAKNAAMTDELKREHRPPKAILRHRVLCNLLLPALDKAMLRACQAQTFTQLAIAACALERHRLARGSYPESLAALAPEFAKQVPLDPMSGQPFRYERTADGRFRLWSIGWNGKDDGGTVALTGTPASKSRNINFEQGDWVWPVPQQ